MTTPTPTPQPQSVPPTMRVAVELTYIRSCRECRSVAEGLAVSAIGDASVTAIRLVPGNKHAHAVESKSGVLEDAGKLSDATTDALEGHNLLFDAVPHSDTNGFDPQGRD